jgi:tellurite methyltransferase
MRKPEHVSWNAHHSGRTAGDPEPFVVEMLALMPRGLALDVAAGRGRHSLALARAGMKVLAFDSSEAGVRIIKETAIAERLPIWPIVADVAGFPARPGRFDVVINVNFLDRGAIPEIKAALRPGGVLLFDTFLIDQAEIGQPSNPDYLLGHWELRDLLVGMELLRYREGLIVYGDGSRAWRASALAARRGC